MGNFLNCHSLSKAFGEKSLFQGISFTIVSGDKVGLIGPNGSGKSTLLKILAGIENPDSGSVSITRGLKIGYVPQTYAFPPLKPKDVLLEALKNSPGSSYEKELLVQTTLSKVGFTDLEPEAPLLSGGWKKRLSIAKELIFEPDLLLLDEPTNHLDLESLLWLEKFLKKVPTYVVVSHDRYFLQNTTNTIIEISPSYPKGMFLAKCSYAEFLGRKTDFLENQIQQEQSISSKARRESEWLKQSPKARTTKSQSRVDEASRILEQLSQIKTRNRQRNVDFEFVSSERKTQKLVVAKNLEKRLDENILFKNLDFTLSSGSRIGLVGPNGSGKTTLLKLIMNEQQPDMGTIKTADDLKIVYFDQHRSQIPGNTTLREALSPNGDFVTFHGRPVHVNGWCKRFLFKPEILNLPIERLSGGERARIAIAHLLLQPADILLLDEPTNDLDINTLETLEESLLDFSGAIVLITHDRCMIDRVCTSIIALGEAEGIYAEYSQWENAKKQLIEEKKKEEKPKIISPQQPKPKLTYFEKKEFEQIEDKINKLEHEIKNLNIALEQNPINLQELCTAVAIAETELEKLYLRWEELDSKS